jgi:amino acid adenylation domain-containing protein
MTAGQRAMWLLQQLEPQSPLFVIAFAARFASPPDADAFRRTTDALMARHPVLTCAFPSRDGQPQQVVGAHSRADFAEIDARGWDRPTFRSRLEEAAYRPFDLERDPLVRLRFFHADDGVTLLLSVHHVVTDLRSLQILLDELGQFYAAESSALGTDLEPAVHDFGDYAWRQAELLAGPDGERLWSYWRERLGGDLPVLELVTDKPRPAVRSSRGATRRFEFPASLAARLPEFSRAEGMTPYTVLLAAFEILLHKHTGQDDLLIGSPVAARGGPEFERVAGYFANMVVLRADLSGDPTVRDYLGRVRRDVLGALEHQDFPFSLLVEKLRPERDPSRTPIFQAAFAMQQAGEQERQTRLGPLPMEPIDLERPATDFELALTFREEGDALRGFLQYSTDLFESVTADRVIAHYQTLLTALLDGPERLLSELPLAGEGERRQVLVDWNATAADYPLDRCVHGLIAERAASTPDAVAVMHRGRSWRYRELNQRADRIASELRALGVGTDAIVALYAERSFDLIAAMIGVLKAGGAYLPSDPAQPPERVRSIFRDARPKAVLADPRLFDRLSETGLPVICLNEITGECPPPTAKSAARPDDLAYVIYTSGSTGGPKGVMIPHRALTNYTFAAREAFELVPTDRVLQFASLGFDAHVEEIFPCLAAGATLVLRTDDMLDSVTAFARGCTAAGVSVASLPTGFWQELITTDDPGAVAVPSLRLLILGAERLLSERVARWRESVGRRVRLLNTYGPTETTVVATMADVTDDVGEPPIGRPIRNVRVYVLDRGLRPVPVRVPGELCIAGAGLARGYLGLPDLTAEKFVDAPLGAALVERVYRTGDRVRWRADGQLEFLGRLDDQVKVRGYRVEPDEIAVALTAHPGVRDAAVVARAAPGGRTELVGYVAPTNGTAPSSTEMREFLRGRFPDYMVPVSILPLPSLPRTPGGKLDRRRLPEPAAERPELRREYVAPRTPTELALADIWREVLRVDRVGVHDGFFELGGHSLLAVQVVSRLRDRLGVELPLRGMFEEPTVGTLAARLDALSSANGSSESNPPIARAPRGEPLPLSFAQERLWFLDQLEPGNPAMNIPAAVRLTGPLDPVLLERSLRAIIARHEALRPTFAECDGRPVQVITAETDVTIPVTDLSGLPADRREADVRRRAAEEARRPFDLARGPLARAELLRLADDEHVLLVTLHHIIADGWSIAVLVREALAHYLAFAAGATAALPPLSLQFADYAVWQRQRLRGPDLERQLAYWTKALADVPALDLPTDRPRPALQTYRGATVSFALPHDVARGVRQLAIDVGATPFMALLASFQALLQRYSGQDNFAVGTLIAGRPRAELEGLIGFFVNTLAVRADLSGDPTFGELLGRVRETALGVFAHAEMPFEKLVEALRPPRDPSRPPLFQVLFALQNEPPVPQPGGIVAELMPNDPGTSRYDLALDVTDDGKAFRGKWEFNTDLFDRATIERMHGHWLTWLRAAVAEPDRRLSGLPLLTDSEERQILVDWNSAVEEFPLEDCIHRLFEEQAARTPDAVAIIDGARNLDFRELDERANRLAAELAGLGVGPEGLVGLCVERSWEAIVGMLGILKAGGAYLPLDPSYAAERLAFMLADARPKVLLTVERLGDRLPATRATIVCLDSAGSSVAGLCEAGPASQTPARRDPAAYVMYTSGSTGAPKGVIGTHRAKLNTFYWMWRQFPFRAGEVCCQKTPLSFADSVQEVFGPLLRGVPLVVISDADLKDPERLVVALAARRVTRVILVPSLLRAILDAVPNLAGRLPDLTLWIASGEALTLDLAGRFERALPHATLINMYGCSELSDDVTWADVRGSVARGYVSIGKSVSNLRVYVLDEKLRPVPGGVPGELCAGGPGLSPGYLNRPELTAARFVADPFAPGERVYRTGDRVRWRAGGDLEYLGRIDHQVKLRGIRIEPGEIEAAIAKHRGVRQAVVMAREDVPGHRRLVAYVVPAEWPGPDAAELRGFLKSRLPDPLLPAAFVTLRDLPRTPSGKVDRRALPAPTGSQVATGNYVEPRTPAEKALAGVWSELLGVERVGATDNFFDLGGESLLAVRMIARARAAGLAIAPLDLFRYQTVGELATIAEAPCKPPAVEAPGSPDPWLVPLRPDGAGPPAILIHPIEGTLTGYVALASLLGIDRPIWGIRAAGLEEGESSSATVEEMAARYVDAVLTMRWTAPYHLIGWSMGGLIAYEMARRLVDRGERVEFLAVIDQPPQPVATAPAGWPGKWPPRLPLEWGSLLESMTEDQLAALGQQIAPLLPPEVSGSLPARRLRVYLRNALAIRNYRPSAAVLRIHLYRADSSAVGDDPSLGWAAVADRGVEIRTLTGDHHSLLRPPHVAALADSILADLPATE